MKHDIAQLDATGLPYLKYMDIDEECIEYDEQQRTIDQAQREWRSDLTHKHIAFVKEYNNSNFAKKARRRYIKYRQEQLYIKYQKTPDKKIEKEIQSLQNELIDPQSHVSDIQIESAKNYPIENIVKLNRNKFALCVMHADSHPSMNCKKNFAYCHVCNYHADTIQLYRDINGTGFVETVKLLSAI